MKKLFEAKKSIPVIKKDANNPFFKSGYATLSNIIEVVEPILAKVGMFIINVMDGNTLITKICDSETETVVIQSSFILPANGDIQKIGSAITYARRYNLLAMLNLNVEDDDDGNAVKPQPKPQVKAETISKECKAYMDKINGALFKDELKKIGAELAKDTKLTANDKDFLRNIYSEKDAKLK